MWVHSLKCNLATWHAKKLLLPVHVHIRNEGSIDLSEVVIIIMDI
jgi:hypothetical protein